MNYKLRKALGAKIICGTEILIFAAILLATGACSMYTNQPILDTIVFCALIILAFLTWLLASVCGYVYNIVFCVVEYVLPKIDEENVNEAARRGFIRQDEKMRVNDSYDRLIENGP